MNILSLIKSTVERYLGCSQVLAVMNIAAVSILECGFGALMYTFLLDNHFGKGDNV